MSRALCALAVCGAALVGCGADVDAADPTSLAPPFSGFRVDLTSFVEDGDHPFADVEGDPIVPCGAGGVTVEAGALEVRTGFCDPADVVSVLPEDAPAGAVVEVTVSHDNLLADGGQAHLAVVVGDELVFEHGIAMPAASGLIQKRVTMTTAHAAGERIVFHVHNHGANAYALRGLVVLPGT